MREQERQRLGMISRSLQRPVDPVFPSPPLLRCFWMIFSAYKNPVGIVNNFDKIILVPDSQERRERATNLNQVAHVHLSSRITSWSPFAKWPLAVTLLWSPWFPIKYARPRKCRQNDLQWVFLWVWVSSSSSPTTINWRRLHGAATRRLFDTFPYP